jgi:hypothetical protein
MLGIRKRYRVVRRDDRGLRSWSPQTRAQALVRFGQQVSAGGYSMWGGPQLMVLSEEEWDRLGRPGPVDGDDRAAMSPAMVSGDAGQPDPDAPRGLFGWLSSRSR